MAWGARWYDMDGNEVDLAAAEALLRDSAARRVALTDFDGRAHVSTVLLVLDHGWMPDGQPVIFETMAFMNDWEGLACYRTSTKAAALAAHDQACAEMREALARFDAELASMERAPSQEEKP